MIKIKHPTLPVTREVKDAAPWLAAGWLLDAPAPAPELEAAPESIEDAPKPSRRRKAG